MVRAILDGTKTQTRRVVKPQPCEGGRVRNLVNEFWSVQLGILDGNPHGEWQDFKCPYGKVGDRLWVRETFYHETDFHGSPSTWYRADDDTFPGMWKPSIFMRKAQCRIVLEITDVRVERVATISGWDAQNEGVKPGPIFDETADEMWKSEYRILWDSLNAKRGFGWSVNPWVWAITFKKPPTPPDRATE